MISRLIKKISQNSYSIHRAALLIAILSLASQLLAILRDKLLAHTFGAGEVLDVYYAAFRIPDFLYATIASVLAAIVFLPLFTERSQESKEKGENFTNSVFTIFIATMTFLSIVVWILMPTLISFLAPGFFGEKLNDLIFISRVLLLSPILLGISNLIGSLLQSAKKMFFFAIAPVAYNIGIIFGIIFLSPIFGVKGIVYGVVLGTILHILVQVPALRKENISICFTKDVDWQGIRDLLQIASPRIATLGLIQSSQIYLISIATTLVAGSVSVFTFALNIQTVPLSLIGVSYSVAAFPMLVQLFQKNDLSALWGSVIGTMRHIIFWSVPIVCFAIVLRAHIVRVLYGSGEFTWTDTRLTAAVFALMIISLAAQGLSLLFIRTLYAMKRSYLPLFGQIFSLLVTVVVSTIGFRLWESCPPFKFFLEALFRVEDIDGSSVMIIGLAYTVSSLTSMFFLWIAIHKAIPFAKSIVCRKVFIHSFGASLIGASVCYGVLTVLTPYISLDSFMGVVSHAILAALFGGLAWFLILYILGSIELREFTETVRKYFKTTTVVELEQQEL